MAISSVNLSLSPVGATTTQVQVGFDPKTSPLALQSKENNALAQLSAFGQVKMSLADLQNKAQALKDFSKPPTFQDFQLVVQSFVQSLNSLNRNISQLATRQDATSADNRPGQALNSVRKAVEGNNQNTLSAMQKMGVSQQAGGMFSINQGQLEKSFQGNRPGALATMHEVANRVAQVADKQLTVNGYIGKQAINLSTRINDFGNTRSTAQVYSSKQQAFRQASPAQQSSAGSNTARIAVANYTTIAAL